MTAAYGASVSPASWSNAAISGLIRSSGSSSGNTMVEALPLADISASAKIYLSFFPLDDFFHRSNLFNHGAETVNRVLPGHHGVFKMRGHIPGWNVFCQIINQLWQIILPIAQQNVRFWITALSTFF